MPPTTTPAITTPDADDPASGRPLEGPGSLGRLAPRAVALLIDWGISSLIAAALLGYTWGGQGGGSFKPLLVFAIENILLVGTIGFTIGHRIMGLHVQNAFGGMAGPLRGLIRTVLLCLVIPAVITDQYGRGLHDKIAGTLIVRTR